MNELRLTFSILYPDLYRLQVVMKREGIDYSEAVRRAIDEYVERQEEASAPAADSYCDKPGHRNDPDWNYRVDSCPYCQIEQLEARIIELEKHHNEEFNQWDRVTNAMVIEINALKKEMDVLRDVWLER